MTHGAIGEADDAKTSRPIRWDGWKSIWQQATRQPPPNAVADRSATHRSPERNPVVGWLVPPCQQRPFVPAEFPNPRGTSDCVLAAKKLPEFFNRQKTAGSRLMTFGLATTYWC